MAWLKRVSWAKAPEAVHKNAHRLAKVLMMNGDGQGSTASCSEDPKVTEVESGKLFFELVLELQKLTMSDTTCVT